MLVIAASAGFVIATGMRPSYDPYGWLVWGRQVLHWDLNTDGAPSWKPLTFLFTLPYALAGGGAVGLWMVTSVAGTLAGAVFAARIAFRIAGGSSHDRPGRPWAPYVAGAFAGVGLLGMNTYEHLVLIANSDQLNVALLLAAIDAHLSRHPRAAFGLLVLASLGRPEAWPFTAFYGVWLWRSAAGARVLTVIGLAVVPASWFIIPALTSKSWMIAGDLALDHATVIHGDKILGVLQRWRSLYEWPMQAAALLGVAIAMARRDRVTLALAGLSAGWAVVEIAFAYHGWSAVSRYLIEPEAVAVVIAGATVSRLLAGWPGLPRVIRLGGLAAVVALVAGLFPAARNRARAWHAGVTEARAAGTQVKRLGAVIAADGGGGRIRACGQPVSRIGYQSTLAWEVGLNVGNVGYDPGKAINRGKPIVLFKPYRGGWQVRPYHLDPATAASCARLRIDSAMG